MNSLDNSKRWTKSEIWSWYSLQKMDKQPKGRGKAAKIDDEHNIRCRAVINGDRLIIGLWQGANAVPKGVYYMTPAGGHFGSNDGVSWCSIKFDSVIFGSWYYYRNTYNYVYNFIFGGPEAEEWLNKHFNKVVRRWSGASIATYIDDIERTVQSKKRELSLKRKHDRINNWLSGLPPYPSDINDFITNTVFGGLHYAFGRKKCEDYSCSACGREFKTKDFKHGKFYSCPHCGVSLKCEKKHSDISLCSRVMLVQSYHDIKGNACSIKREIYVSKDFLSNEEKISLSDGALVVLPIDGTLASGDCVYYKPYKSWTDKNYSGFRHERCFCYPDLSALSGTAYDVRAIEAAAKKGWRLHYNNLMMCYYDEPRMEYLIKGGFYSLVEDLTVYTYRSHNLMPGEDIQSVLGLDGQGVARLRENNGNIDYLVWLRAGFMCGYKLPEKTLKYFCDKHITPTEVSVPLNCGVSPEKIANYIEKQRKLCGRSAQNIVITWRDTLNMSSAFSLKGGSYTIFPKNVVKRHNELVGIKNAMDEKRRMQSKLDNLDYKLFGLNNNVSSIEEKHPKVKEICERIKSLFEWSDGSYSVLVPSCIQDVLIEGYLLGHCIAKPKDDGTYLYFERIEDEESYICFLRKNDNLKAPWYTMEVEPGGAIRQLRTFGDDEGSDRAEAKAFLKKWRAKVRSRLGAGEIKAAVISREKRLAEFAELRRNQNRIYNGKLKGLLLADVLEADFKEFNSEEFAEAI